MKAARLVVLGLSLLCISIPAAAWPHFRIGGIGVGVGYTHFSGVPGYGYWGVYSYPWGYSGYPPGFWGYDPFWSPYGLTALSYRQANKGEVQLKSGNANGEVYINGAYAGEIRRLRHIWLDAGVYELEVRVANQPPAQKRIYVLTGKTLKVRLGEGQR
jgi:hypothetical protein